MAAEEIINNWYALRVKARSEKLIATIAQHKGFEEFVPVYRSSRRWSDRTKSLEIPLFPGYVFCRLESKSWLPLLTIPGVLHFVSVGKAPAPIDASEMLAIRMATESGCPTEPWPFLNVGPKVRLGKGPLAGLEGRLVEIREQYRMVVSVTLLKRSVAVELDRTCVSFLDDPGNTQSSTPLNVERSWDLLSARNERY